MSSSENIKEQMDEYDGLTPKQIRDIEDAEREEYAVSRMVFGRDNVRELNSIEKWIASRLANWSYLRPHNAPESCMT